MATRFCASCGTEVDETASFCPTCGQPTDQAALAEIPEAPAWPDPEPSEREPEPVPDVGPARDAARHDDQPTRVEARPADSDPEAGEPPPPQPAQRAAPPEPERSKQSASPSVNVPFTMPVTLSAWLIGAGAVAAALGLVIGLFDGVLNPIDLILLLALIGVAATVFSANVPDISNVLDISNLRLVTLVVVLMGFGIALDRIGFGRAGVGDLLLFLGTAAAVIGAVMLELGHDQPLGGPGR